MTDSLIQKIEKLRAAPDSMVLLDTMITVVTSIIRQHTQHGDKSDGLPKVQCGELTPEKAAAIRVVMGELEAHGYKTMPMAIVCAIQRGYEIATTTKMVSLKEAALRLINVPNNFPVMTYETAEKAAKICAEAWGVKYVD